MPAATRPGLLHPLHAILLAFPVVLFTGALVSDIAYLNTAEMQWSNFAAWMITFALVFGGPVLLWSLLLLVRRRNRGPARLYFACLAVAWVLGLVNAFQHSRDAWASVGVLGLLLSLVSTGLILVAGWIGFSATVDREMVR